MSANSLSTRLSNAGFLRNYWQRRPLLIRDSGIQLPHRLDKAALFKHSQDQRLAARLVHGQIDSPNAWTVNYGPFETAGLINQPAKNWTLLVQDLDKVRPDCATLLEQFSFLPRWRLDDVMASYAVPGGSVGPHSDQYDVFLIQLHGFRRWQWSTDYSAQHIAELELKVLQQFSPEHDEVLEPGDILYLPPGVAHFGIAESECITLSIGLRAPSAGDLIISLAEYGPATDARYSDPGLSANEQNQLNTAVADRIRQQLQQLLSIDDTELLDNFGRYITQYRLAEDLLDWSEQNQQLTDGSCFQRQAAARLAWRACADNAAQSMLYCNGESMACSTTAARLLCDRPTFRLSELQAASADYTRLVDWLLEHAAFKLSGGRTVNNKTKD